MKYLLLASLSLVGFASGATLQLTTDASNATVLNNFSDSPASGMPWGVVVDTSGNGFADYSSQLSNFTLGNGFIGSTDDFFYLASNATLSVPVLGTAAQIFVDYAQEGSVVGSQNYKLLWFDNNKVAGATILAGENFGLTSVTALLPASNGADITPTDFHGDNGAASLTVIPEPSAMLLSVVGALALLRRRR